jgi:hypothetical protein
MFFQVLHGLGDCDRIWLMRRLLLMVSGLWMEIEKLGGMPVAKWPEILGVGRLIQG